MEWHLVEAILALAGCFQCGQFFYNHSSFQEPMRAVLSISKIINQKQADAPKQMHLPKREYVQIIISIHILK